VIPVIPTSARHLRDQFLATARSKGVPLEERFFRLELGLPVLHLRLGDRPLRGCHVRFPGDPAVAEYGNPDVITVHGSGERSSKMWPRKIDGTFNIVAATDHLLHLVEVEVSRRVPDLDVPRRIPPGLSGLYVMHLAGVRLGKFPATSKPEIPLEALDETTRARIENKIAKGMLIEADIRKLDLPNELHFGRGNKMDFDPFHIYSDRSLPVVVLGRNTGTKVERRFVLVIDDHDGTKYTVADPAGDGLVEFTRADLEEAWKLGARKGVKWAGSLWVG